MRTRSCTLAGVVLASQAAVVLAQDTPADFSGLEEVVVTAQKREQSLQDVPIAIAALSADALANAGVQDMYDVAAQVPSLSVQQNVNPLNVQFRLRGVGNLGNIPNFEPAVAYFVDGAFRARSGLALGDLVDIERIEVLKGPQSTLYGKNSTAGVVAVHTREPGQAMEATTELRAGQIQGVDQVSTWQAKAALSGPVSDAVSIGISGAYFDQDALFQNPFTGNDFNDMSRYSVRGQVVVQPTDALKLRLILAHAEILDSNGSGEGDFFYGTVPAALNGAFGRACPDNDPTNRVVCRNYGGEGTMKADEATLIATYRFGNDYELTSLTSWDEYEMTKALDADQLSIYVADFNDRQAGEAIQQELRVASAADQTLSWIAGAFYYESDFERGNFPGRDTFVLGTHAPFVPLAPGVPAGQPGNAGSLLSENSTKYMGVFAQSTWSATDWFSITAGLRWQQEEKATTVSRSLNHATPSLISIALLPATVAADLERETDAVSWSLTPQAFLSDDVMAYATAAHGFKSGGFNGDWGRTTAAQREFADEEVDHYEFGVKSRFADNRLQLNAAAFYSSFADYQEAGFVALQFLVTNAQKVTVKGVEVDLTAQLADSLTAELNATYSEAQYDSFAAGSCYPGRTPTNAALGSCDLSGQPLTNAPELKTHAALQYMGDVFYARADWTWSDEYFTNSNHDPRQIQGSFSLIDARLGVKLGSWDVSLWGENLLDETYVQMSGVSNLFATDPAYQSFLGFGRSYGLGIKYAL